MADWIERKSLQMKKTNSFSEHLGFLPPDSFTLFFQLTSNFGKSVLAFFIRVLTVIIWLPFQLILQILVFIFELLAILVTPFYPKPPSGARKVVIVGGSFAGLLIARKLQNKFRVTVIDRKEYFEFLPGILRALVMPSHQSGGSSAALKRNPEFLSISYSIEPSASSTAVVTRAWNGSNSFDKVPIPSRRLRVDPFWSIHKIQTQFFADKFWKQSSRRGGKSFQENKLSFCYFSSAKYWLNSTELHWQSYRDEFWWCHSVLRWVLMMPLCIEMSFDATLQPERLFFDNLIKFLFRSRRNGHTIGTSSLDHSKESHQDNVSWIK